MRWCRFCGQVIFLIGLGVVGFELFWRLVTDAGVFSLAVVVGDVVVKLSVGYLMVILFGDFQFGLDGTEARFHECIVVAVVWSAHALHHAGTT